MWDWGYNDKSGKSEKTSVAENVADFENSIALLENGDVVRTYEPNDVMLSDVKEISENEFVAFALKRDGTLWKYDYGECIGGMTADDHLLKLPMMLPDFRWLLYQRRRHIYVYSKYWEEFGVR